MTRRRTFLLGGAGVVGIAAVGGLAAAGRLDDVARDLGIDPVPRPVDSDRAVLAAAATDTAALLTAVGTSSALLTDLLSEHLDALGGAPDVDAEPAADQAALLARCAVSAADRRQQALDAVSPDLARTLASMSVCLGLVATGQVAS